jgi:hypothetical protein
MFFYRCLFLDIAAGYHLHAKPGVIKKMMAGIHVPYLFHVNWMNGNEKKPTLVKTKNWYVRDECSGKESHELTNKTGGIYGGCCMASYHIE